VVYKTQDEKEDQEQNLREHHRRGRETSVTFNINSDQTSKT